MVAGVVHARLLRWTLAPVLLIAYGVYVARHFRSPGEREVESEAAGEVRPLYLLAWWDRLRRAAARRRAAADVARGRPDPGRAGADHRRAPRSSWSASTSWRRPSSVPSLVFALLVAPVATELPEQFNGVIWIRRRKDTLAMGNVTGAMVFQSSFPVSVGLLLTPVAPVAGGAGGRAGRAGGRRRGSTSPSGMLRTLPAWLLMLQVVLYAGYVGYVLTRHLNRRVPPRYRGM